MEILTECDSLRRWLEPCRGAGQRLALVPTMGNLHQGHFSLVERARQVADRVVVSIFVNPLQFGPGEDLDSYPRTLDQDARGLEALGVDGVFAPSEGQMYPNGRSGLTRVEVPGLSYELCGASRSGHFVGVTTVVNKLFNLVGPDVAVFGEKDFQQLTLIRRMVADLSMPVEVIGVPTVREPSGLAMSSRNGYLSADERAQAAGLYATLVWMGEQVRGGSVPLSTLETQARGRLQSLGFSPEYVSVRRAADLTQPGEAERALVILAAARLGATRLIDNLLINMN